MGKERHLSAFNHHLLAAIAKQEHFRLDLKGTFDPILELKEGKVQAILTTLQPDYLNENDLLFSRLYFPIGPVLITSSALPVEGWNEKRKKIIGILRRSPILLSLEQDPSIQIKVYDDMIPALSDLREQHIDGAIFPAIPAYTYITTFYKDELKIATLPLNAEGIRLVTSKNDVGESLIEKFNQGLEVLKQNGTYHEMVERWGFIDVEQMP